MAPRTLVAAIPPVYGDEYREAILAPTLNSDRARCRLAIGGKIDVVSVCSASQCSLVDCLNVTEDSQGKR